jgi:Flp pilus assembly protein TadB
MKNLTKICLLVIGTSTLLTSCGNMTFTKRHYNKGYYVDLGLNQGVKNNKVKDQEKRQNKVKIIEETKQNEVFLAEINNSSNYEQENVSASVNDGFQNIAPAVEKTTYEKSVKIEGSKNSNETSSFTKLKDKAQNLRLFSKVNKMQKKAMKSPASGEAHSLLWIIVVVILILWLIGFLFGGFGVGNLYNLLLLIALILLILWLLRII